MLILQKIDYLIYIIIYQRNFYFFLLAISKNSGSNGSIILTLSLSIYYETSLLISFFTITSQSCSL